MLDLEFAYIKEDNIVCNLKTIFYNVTIKKVHHTKPPNFAIS